MWSVHFLIQPPMCLFQWHPPVNYLSSLTSEPSFAIVVQLLSHVWLFATPWSAACWASLSFIISQNFLKFMSSKLEVPSNHLILCHPLLLPSILANIRVFTMSWLFATGGQSIGASASASVLPMNIQDWFPLGLTGLISLLSRGLLRVFSNTTVRRHQFFGAQPSLWFNSHIHTWLLENYSFNYTDLCQQNVVCGFLLYFYSSLFLI